MSLAKDRQKEDVALEPIFEYLSILHAQGVHSPEADQFKQKHLGNKRFRRLAKGAERLFENKDEILAELEQLDAQPSNR